MKRILLLPLLLLVTTLPACGGPRADQPSADHFTALKATHLDFIDQCTGNAGRTYDDAAVASACARGARQFDDAKTYMESRKDTQRLAALAYLRGEFDKDCAFVRSVEKLLSPSYANERKTELTAPYDHAIAAEYNLVGTRK